MKLRQINCGVETARYKDSPIQVHCWVFLERYFQKHVIKLKNKPRILIRMEILLDIMFSTAIQTH